MREGGSDDPLRKIYKYPRGLPSLLADACGELFTLPKTAGSPLLTVRV